MEENHINFLSEMFPSVEKEVIKDVYFDSTN